MEAGADFSENLDHDILVACRSQKFAALVASERNKVKVVATSDALEVVRHRKQKEPTLTEPVRVGHPEVMC